MTLVDEPRALSLNKALKTVGELREIAGGSAANTMVGIAEMGSGGWRSIRNAANQ